MATPGHRPRPAASCRPVEEVFGLGDATVIDELRVVWPDGTQNVVTDVPGDRFVLVSQPPAP